MITDESHYLALAAAYARGVLGFEGLSDRDAVARGAELKLHRFKRTAQLPRVRAVIR